MMKNIFKYVFLFLLLILAATEGFSQDVVKTDTNKTGTGGIRVKMGRFNADSKLIYINFKDAIVNANDLYNKGEYDTCIQYVQYSLRGWGSKVYEREALLELLVECYLEKDDLQNADRSVVRLLHNNPHYEVSETGNTTEDFNTLVDRYQVFPCFSIGVRNTEMKTTYNTIKTYSLPNNPGVDYTAPYVSNYTWYVMYYGWMEYEFSKDWSVNVEAIKYNLSYHRLLANTTDLILDYNENMSVYRLPVYLRRYAHIGKNFLCYAGLGFSYERIAQAVGNENYYNSSLSSYPLDAGIDVTNLKNQNNWEWLVAGGFGYTLKRIHLFLDMRYYGGLTSLTNSSTRYSNQVWLNDYHYVDGDVKLNQFEFGASASITLSYTAKKKKK